MTNEIVNIASIAGENKKVRQALKALQKVSPCELQDFLDKLVEYIDVMEACDMEMITQSNNGIIAEIKKVGENLSVQIKSVDKRLDGVDKRLDGVDKRLGDLDTRLRAVENNTSIMRSILNGFKKVLEKFSFQ